MKNTTTIVAMSLIGVSSAYADNHVLSLDAVGQHVLIAHHPSQNTAPGGMTVEGWVLWDGGYHNARFFQKSAPSDCEWGLHPSGGDLVSGFSRCGPAVEVYGNAIPANQWTHLAGTWDPTSDTARFYENGVLMGEFIGSPDTLITDYPITMGQQPGFANSQLHGKIDNVRLWNYPRTAQQIQQSMSLQITATDAGNYAGLIGSWSFENEAQDATGVNNGELIGGAAIIVDNFLPAPCNSDVDSSGETDGVDLAVVLVTWGTTDPQYPGADINQDGIVGGEDLAAVLSGWGACP